MDKKRKITVSIIFLIILIFAPLIMFQQKEDKVVEVFIPKGSSPHKIAQILKDSDVISSPKMFLLLIKIKDYSKKLQAGLYDFNKKDSYFTILNKLKNGDSKNIKVIIPEGFNIKQIAKVLSENGICNENKFIELATSQNLEGYLFPNTYLLLPQMDEQEVIKIMNDEFNKFWTEEKEERLKQINKTKKDVIILASIVEREAVEDKERPVIAGIFINRLSKGIRLESCATVLYAMGVNKERLSFEDLKFESPYNTYRHKGLPPGPICNPGAKAIDAVLNPIITENLYFVSKGNGTHYFSSTLEQHVKNKIVSKKKAIK
jgi:UPF0755 protein